MEMITIETYRAIIGSLCSKACSLAVKSLVLSDTSHEVSKFNNGHDNAKQTSFVNVFCF